MMVTHGKIMTNKLKLLFCSENCLYFDLISWILLVNNRQIIDRGQDVLLNFHRSRRFCAEGHAQRGAVVWQGNRPAGIVA